MSDNPQLQALYAEREAKTGLVEHTLGQAQAREEGKRDLSDSEKETLRSTKARISAIDEQIVLIEDYEKVAAAHQRSASTFTSTGGGQDRGDGKGDGLGARTQPRGHEYESRGEVIVDMIRAAGVHDEYRSERDPQARERLISAGVTAGASPDELRAVSKELTTDVPGLLPKPIVGPVQNDLDASRPFIQSIGARDLGVIPGKTFSRPTVTQHTVSGKQTAELAELPSRKYLVGSKDFTKETHGGTLDVARQTMDFTSPAAWDALLTDLQAAYAIDTEEVAVADFVTSVTEEVELTGADHTVGALVEGLYQAAAKAYGGVKRLPNGIWMSLDMWAKVGAAIDTVKATTAGSGGGSSSVSAFAGNMLNIERTVVPSMPEGTIIVGVKEQVEFYEQRIGLLSAVLPSVLGVQIAYGGYVAYGTLKPAGFSKLVVDTTP